MTGYRAVWSVMRSFVEPVQLLYVLMFSVSLVPMDRIYIDKVCQVNLKDWIHSLNLTTDVCQHLTKNASLAKVQNRTQEIVSELKTYEGVMMSVPAIVFSLFAGSYSDQVGRRPLLAIPFLGNIFSYLAILINLYWWDQLPAEFLLTSGIAGLSGGYVCLNIGLYSYIADTTLPEKRTCRMSILNGIFSLGFVIGVQLGAATASYWVVILLSLGFGCLGLSYTIFVLKESNRKENIEATASLISRVHIKESFKTAFRRREDGRHLAILVLLSSFLVLMLCINTTDFDFLMTRLKFDWESQEFSNYLTVQRLSRLTSLLVLLPILSSIFKVSDTYIILFGLLVTTLAYLLLCLTPISWLVYMSAIMQMNSVTTVSIRAQLSKQVDTTEIGKIFAVVGIGQSLISLVSHSLFGVIYRLTLSTFPTAYLVIVVISLSTAFISVLVLEKTRKIEINQTASKHNLSPEQEENQICLESESCPLEAKNS
eukprot:GFUD01043604.1.p1 GENE.GFUD01043604.1~~GFUD01043604.1.p1  ORF type:complete len:483 (+),score=90.62 GFUD01043604.1:175-1623(+)